MNLKSIAEEEAHCRAAFVGIEVGAFVLHCHHNSLLEVLTEPAENRINYILCDKPEAEQALRLRLFRPVPPEHLSAEWDKACAEWHKARAEWDKADAEWDKARAELAKARAECEKSGHHAVICPGCPWDGSTIFAESTL